MWAAVTQGYGCCDYLRLELGNSRLEQVFHLACADISCVASAEIASRPNFVSVHICCVTSALNSGSTEPGLELTCLVYSVLHRCTFNFTYFNGKLLLYFFYAHY